MPEESVTPPGDDVDREQQLEAVLADYIRASESGLAPDRREILERHPNLASDLRNFFANRDQMDRLAQSSYDKSTAIHSEAELVGLCIGSYTLVQKLGEGGMGEVWVAKQSVPVKRKVALKLIKRGMNSKDVLARFEQERQALAMMDHPNIAKVFDGGVVGERRSIGGSSTNGAETVGPPALRGQPYFVMELVNGLSLTKFCDEARLTPRERMELFVLICQAVQHAHQKGIVHRDLKPSNILVTMYDGRPVPKVIDFGVAKATGGRLTDESMSTQFGAVVGTLEYMSPEQAGFSGHDIDTRADIYSLGVILYELLTGLRPIDGQRLRNAALAEMIRIIQEEEPSKPSMRLSSDAALPSLAAQRQTEPKRLTALLRGELDWVVMKCLEKSRDRRYETVNGLARDIQRYLADEPVEARPASASYRIRKFLRRNKSPVLAASLVLLALLGGIIGTTWGLVRESKQRQIAETNEGNANDATKQERIAKEEERIAKEKAIAAAIEERKQRDRADENARLARRRLYVAHMNLAKVAWADARAGETIRLLDLYRPAIENEGDPNDLRGFEWHYWNRLAHSYQMNLQGHTGPVYSVAFSPDGKRLASASFDQTVKVWDATSGQETLTLKGHTHFVRSVAFSPDGKRLASASEDQTVKVWDATSGQETLTLKGHTGPFYSVTFSPDGKRLASVSDNKVKVWDATSGQEMLTLNGHRSYVTSMAFSPDGKRLASACWDETLKVWDATSGQEMLTLKGQPRWVMSVAFSPDGKRLASACRENSGAPREVKVWNAMNGQEMLTLKGQTHVAFSPDGKRLASASEDQTVRVWDATSGQEMFTLKGHTHAVMSVAFSPDGKRLASASEDQTVKVWDATGGQDMLTLKGQNHAVFSPDGKRLASIRSDNTLRVWDATSGQEMLTLKGHTDLILSVAFSPDGKWLASACRDQTVKVWDATSGQETLTWKGHTRLVRSVAFSPDGERLASASGANGELGEVKVWDAISGQEMLTLKGYTHVAFSPDGKRLASASVDQALSVKVWDATSGQELLTLERHRGYVTSVTFSPDGKRLASASRDQTVKVWDATTGQEMFALNGHTDVVTSVAFSADGKRLASASEDQTVKVWDATSGQETLTLKGHTFWVHSVAFSPDGKRLASASGDATVKVWDARPWTPELRAEQQALGLIRFLRAKPLAKPSLLDAIVADATISEPVRQRALELARDWPEL